MLTLEQLRVRQQGIGGSDAPIICGLSRFMTARELFHVKRGAWSLDESVTWEAQVGTWAEPVIVNAYEHMTGNRAIESNATVYHPKYRWMLGHADRLLRDADHGLECKQRASRDGFGAEGSDEIPDDIRIQCAHYMEIYNKPAWDICVWFAPWLFQIFRVERDRELAENLIDIEAAFWSDVQAGREPDFDLEHPTTSKLIDRLYPGTSGAVVELGDDLVKWHQVALEAAGKAKEYGETARLARNHLKRAMGNAAIGVLLDHGSYHRTVNPKTGAVTSFRFKPGKFFNVD